MSDFVTLSETNPRARIPHECDWCLRVIDPGETYRRTGQIFDGRKYAWKACRHCDAMVSELKLFEWALDSADYGLGHEDIGEYEPVDVFEARCVVMWKRKWRRKDGTLYPIPAREAVSDGQPHSAAN